MIDINKEAEEYAKSSLLNRKAAKHFIAGYNSKATQAKILQAKIETINMIINCYNLLYEDINDLKLTISRLQQQLKELENDNS
jgi:hypothetical protein